MLCSAHYEIWKGALLRAKSKYPFIICMRQCSYGQIAYKGNGNIGNQDPIGTGLSCLILKIVIKLDKRIKPTL